MDQTDPEIGPPHASAGSASDPHALVVRLARAGTLEGRSSIKVLRAATAEAVRRLPADHPLAGVDVSGDSEALLVRLLCRAVESLPRTVGGVPGEGPERPGSV